MIAGNLCRVCTSVVHQLPKLRRRVRLPYPAFCLTETQATLFYIFSLLKSYNEQKFKLAGQRKELKDKIEHTEDGVNVYAEESATLELTYQAVQDKYDEYKGYMDQLMEQWDAKFNEVVAGQQADAAKEYGEEMSKLMKVAIRIMHGDIVPLKDEQKLMEFDSDLYQMAKNIGAMAERMEKKRYESLWDDEQKKDYEDPVESADDQEAFANGPEVVSVEQTMESVDIG